MTDDKLPPDDIGAHTETLPPLQPGLQPPQLIVSNPDSPNNFAADVVEIEAARRARGRPSSYTRELGLSFCSLFAGGMFVTDICKLPGMPSRDTIFEWLTKHADFSYAYACARELNADHWFERANEMALACDDPMRAQLLRVQIDTIKWRCAKLSRRYNDRHIQEVSGPNGGPVEVESTQRLDAASMAPESREQLRALLLQAKAKPSPGG